MENIYFYLVEPFLSSGTSTFTKILGKSFPNDLEIAQKHGKIIYLSSSNIDSIGDKMTSYIQKLGFNPDTVNQKFIRRNFVKFHEF
jgi:hypothetical protein